MEDIHRPQTGGNKVAPGLCLSNCSGARRSRNLPFRHPSAQVRSLVWCSLQVYVLLTFSHVEPTIGVSVLFWNASRNLYEIPEW